MPSKACTFFGYSDTPEDIRPVLRETLIGLIENCGADRFYVGSQGSFDRLVKAELKKLSEIYPHIRYSVVLAYMPGKRREFDMTDYSDTVYPEGMELVPRKFAIDRRNRMMVEWADIVVTYVRFPGGGATKFKELAEKKGKRVIELYRR